MKSKQILVVILYSLGMLIILSWFFLCSFDDFLELPSKGFLPGQIRLLPKFLRPAYEGMPNFITLLTYVVFTFSAFLLLREKETWSRFISLSSFLILIWLFYAL